MGLESSFQYSIYWSVLPHHINYNKEIRFYWSKPQSEKKGESSTKFYKKAIGFGNPYYLETETEFMLLINNSDGD